MKSCKNLLVLISGGRSSAMMARHIQTSYQYKHYNKCYVFTNTGQERPETIHFLKQIVDQWEIPLYLIEGKYSLEPGIGVKHSEVTFDTLDMDSKVFESCIKHSNKLKWTGVPNPATPYCSSYLKVRPAHSFAKKYFGTTNYVKALGYRKEDIPKRITPIELIEYQGKIIAPLLTDFEVLIGLNELDEYFNHNPFKLNLDSDLGNCELCWKKSKKNLKKAIKRGARSILFYERMQSEYGNNFFRENLTIQQLIKEAYNENFTGNIQHQDEDSCVCSFL